MVAEAAGPVDLARSIDEAGYGESQDAQSEVRPESDAAPFPTDVSAATDAVTAADEASSIGRIDGALGDYDGTDGGSDEDAATPTIDVGADVPDEAERPACGVSPWVLVGVVPNARQLGGVPLADDGVVACDKIYRGSSLASVTTDGCARFASTGINTLIDLRSVSEQASPPADCVTEHAKLVSAPLPIPYSMSPADYLADLYTAPSMRTVFATLADPAAYPVYYYCLYGRDRTGVLTAVILSTLGASRKTIQDEYALTREAGLSGAPESLNAVLDEIDRIGGIDAYFRAIGVPPSQVQAVRKILATPRHPG
jgi:protein-tyrosine phosphatase